VLILVFINDLALLNHYVKIIPKKCFDWCSFVTEKEKPKIAAFKGGNSCYRIQVPLSVQYLIWMIEKPKQVCQDVDHTIVIVSDSHYSILDPAKF